MPVKFAEFRCAGKVEGVEVDTRIRPGCSIRRAANLNLIARKRILPGQHVKQVRHEQFAEGAADRKPAARGRAPIDDKRGFEEGRRVFAIIVDDAPVSKRRASIPCRGLTKEDSRAPSAVMMAYLKPRSEPRSLVFTKPWTWQGRLSATPDGAVPAVRPAGDVARHRLLLAR